MAEKLFKGLRQVTKAEFDSVSSSDRVGTLWFVREFEGSKVKSYDIYLGNRRYGHYGYEDESISEINNVLTQLKNEISELYQEIEEITGDIKLEEATDETIADGHIELKRNDNNELYGLMYYQE